jgi:flagellum-specific peptidoglycan hydrolase FlgJ
MNINNNRLPAPLDQFRHIQIGRYTTQEWLTRHWFKALVLLVVGYVFTQKDLSFSVNMRQNGSADVTHSAPPTPANATIGSPTSMANAPTLLKTDNTDAVAEASVVGGLLELGSAATSKATAKTAAPVGNTMSNLAPILNPAYIKKHKIAAAVVDEKMDICRNYVSTYSAAAVQEMKTYGIPASITLAQGLLESNAGASLLARKANNHFGIKCFSKTCKRGHCMNATDDTHKDFFRMYPSGKNCYRAHSEFLQSDRYKLLKKLGNRDYKNWAKGLKKAGYATAPHYAEALITIVESLKLYQYDK